MEKTTRIIPCAAPVPVNPIGGDVPPFAPSTALSVPRPGFLRPPSTALSVPARSVHCTLSFPSSTTWSTTLGGEEPLGALDPNPFTTPNPVPVPQPRRRRFVTLLDPEETVGAVSRAASCFAARTEILRGSFTVVLVPAGRERRPPPAVAMAAPLVTPVRKGIGCCRKWSLVLPSVAPRVEIFCATRDERLDCAVEPRAAEGTLFAGAKGAFC